MFSEEVRAFLQKKLTARLSVVDADGYPHTVPVWFKLDGDDLIVISVRDTRKVGYAVANPKGSLTIGGDPADGGGYLIKGDWCVEPDPGLGWMKALTRWYEESEQAEKDIVSWSDLDMIVMRLKPRRVIKVA